MSLHDEFQKRLDAKPDQYTLAWWEQRFQELQKAYRGACHAVNLAVAEAEELRRRVADLESCISDDSAKIGELQARVERMADFLTRLKQGNGN